jgi:hypothetical protein
MALPSGIAGCVPEDFLNYVSIPQPTKTLPAAPIGTDTDTGTAQASRSVLDFSQLAAIDISPISSSDNASSGAPIESAS